jgi:hypothetical protein
MERFNLKRLTMWKLKKSMSLKPQIGLQLRKTFESIRENITVEAIYILGYYELEQHKLWFDEECPNYSIKGNMLKSTGSRIKTK